MRVQHKDIYTYSMKHAHMYKLAQPLSKTMLVHHGALDRGEREREGGRVRDVHKEGYMDAKHIIMI